MKRRDALKNIGLGTAAAAAATTINAPAVIAQEEVSMADGNHLAAGVTGYANRL